MTTDATEQAVRISAAHVTLDGDLTLPPERRGIVLFAHGSGSGRTSPRNRSVAEALNRGRLATLLMDLLTSEEEFEDLRTAKLRFDIPLLAERLVAAIDWLGDEPSTRNLPLGCFGASTGAAAALVAAARRPERVRAVVSRGGRPDLAGDDVGGVRAPTLLVVGELDDAVMPLNEDAARRLLAETRLETVAGARHLFEEPGALDEVARLAAAWFADHL